MSSKRPDDNISKIQSVLYLIVGILEILLGIRVILSVLGANKDNGFANFIYNTSDVFVKPFWGLFNYEFESGVSRLEIETIVAMAVYFLIVWIIIRVIELTKSKPSL
jgi:hypothetical protein